MSTRTAKVRKIASNFGEGAWRTLGWPGYFRYLGTATFDLPMVIGSGDLRPVDRDMSGVWALRHPLTGRTVRIDLSAYRAGDDDERSWTFGLIREIWIRGVYLRPFAFPGALGCVLDLGANRGIFALQAAAIASRVIAVEPNAGYAKPLARNLELNGYGHVEVVNAMVGSPAAVDLPDARWIGLGELVAMADALPLDLVKIDIEGSEFGLDLEALVSASRIAMEIHPRWGEPAALHARLRALGFDCRTFDEAMAPVAPAQADFLFAVNTRDEQARWAS